MASPPHKSLQSRFAAALANVRVGLLEREARAALEAAEGRHQILLSHISYSRCQHAIHVPSLVFIDIDALSSWLHENIDGMYVWGFLDESSSENNFYFQNENDALLFKLRWG